MSEEALLSISEASHIIGVSETALRQWTDEGKIKAFVTPGGHRRYTKAELKRFMSSHPKMLGLKDLALELEDTVPQHREIAHKLFESMQWYEGLSEELKVHLAEQGRELLKLIVRYITEPSRQGEIIDMVRENGRNLGKTLSGLGLTLTDSVEAFIAHRDPILSAATHLLKKREASSGRLVEAIPLVARVMDEALVALVAAHQQYRNGAKSDSAEGTSG
ncbi:MAG: helix-turn-helix domain-containing protein [Chloroflexi bacterium]|nr:helix-turn-helix domain-containing protein [Chloroflexota bacterium]